MSDIVIEGLNLNVDQLRASIREEYSAVADDPGRGFHFHTGRKLAKILGYPGEWIDALPASAVESMAGTGNPFSLGEIKPGETVVDVGSGAGADSLIAARLVGPAGRVVGVDMTPEMLAKARRSAAEVGLTNVEFREGYLEALPVPDEWADVVISNGALNLVPDKDKALAEMYRVLKPGGRLQIADILLQKPVPGDAQSDVSLWTGCIAGGLLKAQLERKVKAAGFKDFEVVWGEDVFSGAPQSSSAAEFGTLGVIIRAQVDLTLHPQPPPSSPENRERKEGASGSAASQTSFPLRSSVTGLAACSRWSSRAGASSTTSKCEPRLHTVPAGATGGRVAPAVYV